MMFFFGKLIIKFERDRTTKKLYKLCGNPKCSNRTEEEEIKDCANDGSYECGIESLMKNNGHTAEEAYCIADNKACCPRCIRKNEKKIQKKEEEINKKQKQKYTPMEEKFKKKIF